MTFMHMDATTAASAEGGIVQLLDQGCHSTSGVGASMTLTSLGQASCFKNGVGTFPWNWIDPLSEAPGDPSYQFRRINLVGDVPAFGPLDGVWTPIALFVDFITAISAGGSGYSVNDTLTATGGTFSRPAQYNVDSIGGGGSVATVSLVDEGSYSDVTNPTGVSTAPTTVSPPGGTGALIAVQIAFHFTWGYFGGGLSGSWDVQLRKGTGPVLKTATWSMSTA